MNFTKLQTNEIHVTIKCIVFKSILCSKGKTQFWPQPYPKVSFEFEFEFEFEFFSIFLKKHNQS